MQAGHPVATTSAPLAITLSRFLWPHLERQVVVGQRERTAATTATVGFGHFHKVIARIHTDEIMGLLAHAGDFWRWQDS